MPARSARTRLRLEPLADRCLPTTFTVTNLLDGGPGSLRGAVAAANASPGLDAIDFAVTGTIALTTGQLDIADALTVAGPGAAALTVSGNHASRVFRLVGSPTVAIADLTVADGMTVGSPGGGIAMAGGALTLTRCTVTGNDAVGTSSHATDGGPAAGGGLYVAGGTLTLDRCSVSANTAAGGQGWGGVGTQVQYGYGGGRGAGGGLYVAGGTVSVNQSTVSGNWAFGGGGGEADWQWWNYMGDSYGGDGGDAAGGGLCVAGGRLEVRESTVSGNLAGGGGGGNGGFYGWPGTAEGGGMFLVSAAPPRADLDSFTVDHTVDNWPDDIDGPYSLNGQPPPPDLTVGDASVVEGHAGTTALVFPVTLSAASSQPVTVGWATADGTAAAGSDYQAASGTLTFAPGETSKTLTVLVNGDRSGEPNETFVVTLSSPTNAAIADGQGVGTITDDEPRISIGDVTKSEGRKNQKTLFTFTGTLSAAYDQPVTVSFKTIDGTATTGDNDYVAQTGTITFNPGETTKTITIEVKGDNKREADETFSLVLTGATNAEILDGTGLGTIANDD